MTDAFPRMDAVLSSSYQMLNTLPANTLLLFGPVMLLCGLKCGTFAFYSMTEGSV